MQWIADGVFLDRSRCARPHTRVALRDTQLCQPSHDGCPLWIGPALLDQGKTSSARREVAARLLDAVRKLSGTTLHDTRHVPATGCGETDTQGSLVESLTDEDGACIRASRFRWFPAVTCAYARLPTE